MSGNRASKKPGFTDESPSKMRHVPWAQHALRQVKLLIPGAALTYYLGTLDEFWNILHGNAGSWARSVSSSFLEFISLIVWDIDRTAALIVSVLGLTTITLFLYVLFLPLITGEEPDVRSC